MKVYTPVEHQQFYCNVCDGALVDSTNPNTGTFYIQFGDVVNAKGDTFDYTGVVFAQCADCEAGRTVWTDGTKPLVARLS